MDKTILLKGAEKYNVNLSELTLLGGYSNNVYEYQGREDNFILKFYLPPYDKNSIQSELDWILFLYKSEIQVAIPIPSLNENYIEVIEIERNNNGEKYYVVAFQKVKGKFIDTQNKKEWNQVFFYQWGKTLGEIHSLAKKYIATNPAVKRYEWNQGILFSEKLNISKDIGNKWEIYVGELETLPKDLNSYGMIHGDLHVRNFFVHNNKIVLFDFGDCEYNWYVYDIAIVLYHAIQSINRNKVEKRTEFAHHFLQSFLEGYQTENHLDFNWLNRLPFFLNFRQIYSYLYFTSFLSNEQREEKRTKEVLDNMKNKIENDIPYIELNLEYIYHKLGRI